VDTYLSLKGENARILKEKGLGSKNRTYDIIGVAHFDAGYLSSSGLSPQNLDLSGVFDALIDVLDLWVDQGVEPPESQSDLIDLDDVASGLRLPEIACPTGVYYQFQRGVDRVGVTGFAAYLREPPPGRPVVPSDLGEEWLEPMDRRGYPVDMNHNSIRDVRETLTQAWKRRGREGETHGTLTPMETLTHARYVSCVTEVASELFGRRLLGESAMRDYIKRATESDIGR
jgi:hypothetical protein